MRGAWSLPFPFTSSFFTTWHGSYKGLLTFSPFISCFFCSHFLLPPFCLSCKEEPELHRKELFAPEYVQSFWSTCISFNFVIVQYGHWRGAVHTSQAAEFQFHRNHQSFRLLGWMLASLSVRVTRPWMWTFREDGVPVSCQVRYRSIAFWALFRLASHSFSTYLISFAFFYSLIPISHTRTHPSITLFLHASCKSSDIHGNQATARTSATKRSLGRTGLSVVL